jgi:hypothetical protein
MKIGRSIERAKAINPRKQPLRGISEANIWQGGSLSPCSPSQHELTDTPPA